MSLYEHVFLARQDVSAQQVEALTETFKSVIADGGGTVDKTEYWGMKSLAFRIKKNRKAHFTLMNIDAPHAAVAEMERQMAISEDVIRFLTLKVDELEAGPSAMMRSRGGRDRDDRRGRRGREDGRPPRDQDGESRPAAEASEAPAKESDSGEPAETSASEEKEKEKEAEE